MPPLVALLPTIAAIGSLASTGVGLGLEISNRPGEPKAPAVATPGVTALEQAATQNAQRAAISQEAPNVISATSGLANPEYVAQISQLLAGTAGQSGSTGSARKIIEQIFGLGGGGRPGVQSTSTSNFKPASSASNGSAPTNTPTNLSDFVTQFLYA